MARVCVKSLGYSISLTLPSRGKAAAIILIHAERGATPRIVACIETRSKDVDLHQSSRTIPKLGILIIATCIASAGDSLLLHNFGD